MTTIKDIHNSKTTARKETIKHTQAEFKKMLTSDEPFILKDVRLDKHEWLIERATNTMTNTRTGVTTELNLEIFIPKTSSNGSGSDRSHDYVEVTDEYMEEAFDTLVFIDNKGIFTTPDGKDIDYSFTYELGIDEELEPYVLKVKEHIVELSCGWSNKLYHALSLMSEDDLKEYMEALGFNKITPLGYGETQVFANEKSIFTLTNDGYGNYTKKNAEARPVKMSIKEMSLRKRQVRQQADSEEA